MKNLGFKSYQFAQKNFIISISVSNGKDGWLWYLDTDMIAPGERIKRTSIVQLGTESNHFVQSIFFIFFIFAVRVAWMKQ